MSASTLNPEAASAYAAEVWARDIIPTLMEYIAIPNVSKAFDTDWLANGHMTRAVEMLTAWSAARPIPGMQIEVVQLPGLTPLIFIDIPATNPNADPDDTVLLYGHLDKQPEMTGWREGLAPWKPVREGDRLYGRGGADDGYSTFASLATIETVHAMGGVHNRCVVIIEASEESGSPDLPAYIDYLLPRLGSPSLVICLDSGCADYEHMWVTTSLRGMAAGALTVKVVEQGLHSGVASGVVPSSMRIMRVLLDRVEDAATGRILLDELHVPIPEDRVRETHEIVEVIGYPASDDMRLTGNTKPMTDDPVEQLLNSTWRPTLSYIAADGFPPPSRAGNVLRPSTTLTLSFRLPPTCDATKAVEAIEHALTTDVPYDATVEFHSHGGEDGWNAPSFAPWLWDSLSRASQQSFGQECVAFGEGGTIPFMGMLGARFPNTQFVITGALGPDANAHGPNEYLHLPTAEKLTVALAMVLHDHAASAEPARAGYRTHDER
jgi:acetylornithine deacetylase/succinyl-diaminopimelate desuccinylase-like protein